MQALRLLCFVPSAVAVLAHATDPTVADSKLNRSSDEQFDALVNGECDAVVTAMDNVFAWNRRPGPRDFQIVAQIERTTPLSLIGSTVKELSAVRGATILVDAPGNGFIIALRAMLADAGIPTDAYSLQEAGGVKGRFDRLLAGDGGATLLGPPFDGMAIAAGMSLVGRIQAAYPHFPGQGVVVRKQTMEQSGTQLRAWLDSLTAALGNAAVNQEVAMDVLVNAGASRESAATMLGNLPDDLHPVRAGVDLLIEHRRKLGLEGGTDTYESLVSTALLAQ